MASLPEEEGLISPDWDKKLASDSKTEDMEVTPAVVPEMKLTPEIGLAPISELEEEAVINSSSTLTYGDEGALAKNESSSEEHLLTAQTKPEFTQPKPLDKDSGEAIDLHEQHKAKESKKEVSTLENELNQLIISEAIDSVIVKNVMEDMEDKRSLKTKSSEITTPVPPSEKLSSDDFIAWLVNNAKSVNYPSFQGGTQENLAPSVDSIIEQFIQTEPQIQRGKAKDYEKGNLASSSLVDKEEFITETLAEIYVTQGNNSKAKRAFQLLSLKYPEKSIYFAARIKQLGRKK